MKSRTSFCDLTAFKKDVTRFAPFWAIYLIGGLMVMMTVTDTSPYFGSVADIIATTIGPFGIINMIYAGLCAQLVFGDLYNSRLCNAMHALPLRREQWFFSHIAAGLCFSIVPHLLVTPLILLRLGEFWFVGLFWLLGMTLEYLFFFGLAAFSSFCVGNRFAMVAVYSILNFGSMIAYWFCKTIYEPMMFGVVISSTTFEKLCPVVQLIDNAENMVLMEVEYPKYQNGQIWHYEGLGDGWGYLAVLACLGVALLGLALLLYRRRKLESAGDFIAVKSLGPIFSVVFTLCVASVCAMFGELFSDGYMVVFLIAGLIIGYFVSQMLLQRTAKVFRKKAFLRLGILSAVMVLSLFLVKWDVFGIVRWLPEADRVKKVSLNIRQLELTDTDDIQKIIDLHAAAIDQGEIPDYRDAVYLRIQYTMDDGRQIQRIYHIPTNSPSYQALKIFYGRPSVVMGYTGDWETYLASVQSVLIDGYKPQLTQAQQTQLLEAIRADCEAGNMSQHYAYHAGKNGAVMWIYVNYQSPSGSGFGREIMVFEDSYNTIDWLKNHKELWVQENHWYSFL